MDIIKVAYESANGIFVQSRVMNRDYVVKASSHERCELTYIVRGKVEMTANGHYVECFAGEVIMLEGKVYHSQRMFDGVDTELYVVEFNQEILPSFARLNFSAISTDNPLWGYRVPQEAAKAGDLLRYFKRIIALSKKKDLPYKDSLMAAEIIQLVSAINTQIDEAMKTGWTDDEVRKQKKDLFEKCIHFINANITKQITLDDLVEALHFSKSYLQHVFKQKMGMSISAYINAQKMNMARSMLAAGEAPSTVAQKLGYEYYTTFSVKFKKHFGISPKDIRKVPLQRNYTVDDKE